MAIKFERPLESKVRFAPVEKPAADERLDLSTRMRRNRRAEWVRRLVREHQLSTDDLIWPLFIMDGLDKRATRDRCRGTARCRGSSA